MVALVTILLYNNVSGEGPEGTVGLLTRGKGGGGKIRVCRVNIERLKTGLSPHCSKPVPKISPFWGLEDTISSK